MDWIKFRGWLIALAVTSAIAFNTWTTAQVYDMRARVAVMERDVTANRDAVGMQTQETRDIQCSIRDVAVDVAYIRGQLEK